MSFIDKILGRPLALAERKKQELSVLTGVPALGLDALASMAYGPEAALMILLPLGQSGLQHFFLIMIAVVGVLIALYLSYQQTAAAYPNGGGAYIVASDNLGKRAGLWAAVALLIDYLLNVSVGISAGVGAIISVLPWLHPHTLSLCLLILLTLTLLNLRGVRESGLVFIVPTLAFVCFIGISVAMGVYQAWQSAGVPHPVVAPPAFPPVSASLSVWLILGAFANGLTAMTGVEAVSNAIPLFRKPRVKNAQGTLTVIVGLLIIFLLGLGYLCPAYGIRAMDESQPGYQTILSQLVAAATGKGIFYYLANISIFIVLTYSAQTSFAGFPRVCRLLAEDNYLPDFFAERGRRLVFSHGIIILSLLSAILLICFKGITFYLIPLFAVGAFSAFLLSQSGMVIHWWRKKSNAMIRVKLFFNALGAITTAIALSVIIAAKFVEGAWIVLIVAPLLILLLTKIKRHYRRVVRQIEKPLKLHTSQLQHPIVIIPIKGWDCVAEKALRFGMLLSDEIIAVNISTESEEGRQALRDTWTQKVVKPAKAAKSAVPKLEIIDSPYRQIYQPILDYVNKTKKSKPKRLIAVIIPELVEPHWYEYLLHNLHAAGLRTLLFLQGDQQTIVITTPWYLHEVRK